MPDNMPELLSYSIDTNVGRKDVTGWGVVPGLAVREVGGRWAVDHIQSGCIVKQLFRWCDKAVEFALRLGRLADWTLPMRSIANAMNDSGRAVDKIRDEINIRTETPTGLLPLVVEC